MNQKKVIKSTKSTVKTLTSPKKKTLLKYPQLKKLINTLQPTLKKLADYDKQKSN
jgi:hypothetical protein